MVNSQQNGLNRLNRIEGTEQNRLNRLNGIGNSNKNRIEWNGLEQIDQ